MDPISAGLLAGGTSAAASAYTTHEQAANQERYMKQKYRAQHRSAEAANRQIVARQSLEAKKIAGQAAAIRSRIRVTAGESGMAEGGTYEALLQQTDYNAWLNEQVSRREAFYNLMAVRYGQNPIESRAYSVLLSGLQGSLEGFQTGLSIGRNIEAAQRPKGHGPAGPIEGGRR